MKLLKYEKATETSTITLNDVELVDLRSICGGIISTLHKQDLTILGLITEERLKKLEEDLMSVIQGRKSLS